VHIGWAGRGPVVNVTVCHPPAARPAHRAAANGLPSSRRSTSTRSQRPAVGPHEYHLAVGIALYPPSALVDQSVMVGAEPQEISHIGWSSVDPMPDVVDVAPPAALATWEAAATVAAADLAGQPRRRGAPGPGH